MTKYAKKTRGKNSERKLPQVRGGKRQKSDVERRKEKKEGRFKLLLLEKD